MVGDRIDILTNAGTKFATGYVERVDPIYTVLRTDTGTPVTINNKVYCTLSPAIISASDTAWLCLHSPISKGLRIGPTDNPARLLLITGARTVLAL